MTTMTTIPKVGFLRLPQVLQLVPISKSAWWEGCKTGPLPQAGKARPAHNGLAGGGNCGVY